MGSQRASSAPHFPAPTARELRAARARIRARLDTAEQDPAPDRPDDGPSPPRRGHRLVWAGVAALPLAAAVLLGIFSPSTGPVPMPTTESSRAVAETADPAAAWRPGTASPSTVRSEARADPVATPGEEPELGSVPAPPGHRAVAVRPVDPAAAELVHVQDAVDVVGLDGTVIVEATQVLQISERSAGRVLVVAVPEQDAARVAAAVVSVEATVVVSRRSSPSEEDAAPTATGPVR